MVLSKSLKMKDDCRIRPASRTTLAVKILVITSSIVACKSDWSDGIPSSMRELQSEGNEFYVEQDCFCSRRILRIDSASGALKVYSWCAFEKDSAAPPDLETLKFKLRESDGVVFEKQGSPAEDPYHCVKMKFRVPDSLVTIETCGNPKKEFFTKRPVPPEYKTREQDCADFDG
jgi:hypothetical protein